MRRTSTWSEIRRLVEALAGDFAEEQEKMDAAVEALARVDQHMAQHSRRLTLAASALAGLVGLDLLVHLACCWS